MASMWWQSSEDRLSLKEPALVKPEPEGKLLVCSQSSTSLLGMTKKTAGTSAYTNTSVMLALPRDRPVNALSLGGPKGLEMKVGAAGNCKTLLGKKGQSD